MSTTTTTTTTKGGRPHQDVRRDVQTTEHTAPQGQSVTTSNVTADPGAPAQYTTQPERDSAYLSGTGSSGVPLVPEKSPRRSGDFSGTPVPHATSSNSDIPLSPSRHSMSINCVVLFMLNAWGMFLPRVGYNSH